MSPHKIESDGGVALPSPSRNGEYTDKLAPSKGRQVANDSPHKIIDIRNDTKSFNLIAEIRSGLQVPEGHEKSLPTLLLYDEEGLKLFEQITYLDQYYLTNAEIELLEAFAAEIAQRLPSGSIVLELGSGNLRKVNILLNAIDKQGKHVDYFALDVSQAELERTLADIPRDAFQHVKCYGLLGTYDDGLEWVQTSAVRDRTKAVISLGSSLGNFGRESGASFLKSYAQALQPQDVLLVGLDGCKDEDRVYHAYNDRDGVTQRFTLNGLTHANTILGEEIFDPAVWQARGRYNKDHGRHEAFVFPTADSEILGVQVKANELLRIEESHKFDNQDITQLWKAAGVHQVAEWSNSSKDYAMHLISKNHFSAPWTPGQYAASPAPSWDEWLQLWKIWDTVTRQMLPDEELLEKPIKLRNACIFYLGHIPGFFDIKLTETYPEQGPTEPGWFHQIFERGIDPDVDNPEQCHAHSEIPDSWPPLEDILAYQQRVRDRVHRMYDNGDAQTVKGARALWLGYEHEAMHLETLLYMLIQSEKTLPPKGAPVPVFENLAVMNKNRRVPNQWFTIPEQDVVLGMNDPETDDGPSRFFGWDIEKPARKVHVHSFEAKARPITIGEYAQYLHATGSTKIPESWVESDAPTNGHANGHTNGNANGQANGTINGDDIEPDPSILRGRKVRTVFGAIPLEYVLDWPVAASYDELAGCAAWMGGRIPTLEETRSIYEHADALATSAAAAQKHGATIPAVNSHLVNSGVSESPPTQRLNAPTATPEVLFADLIGANVGFQTWTPAPVTQNGGALAGQAGMGGLWEWTASPLASQPGYAPMKLYPAYSADFLDGRHNVVLGGSWATLPRIAGRKSFVNWYQRNYPFVWAGARLVRDLPASS